MRELIANGAFAPGLQLRQEELAQRFEVSRVPVREALKILASEGTVTHDPRRGFFVAMLSSSEMRQLYRARRLLETEVIRTVRWPDDGQVALLHRLADAMTKAAQARNIAAWTGPHREFHHAIFDLSPDKFLVREVMRLWSLSDRYRSLLAHARVTPASIDRERELVALLARRDRRRLLAKFDADRTRIEGSLADILAARGL